MKKILTLTLSSLLIIPALTHAEFKGGFADIGLHYLDWTSDTTEKPVKNPIKMILGTWNWKAERILAGEKCTGSSTGKIFTMAATLN